MSELQKAQEKIKVLEERNDVLEQLAIAHREVRLLIKEKMEYQDKELQRIKTATRYIWN